LLAINLAESDNPVAVEPLRRTRILSAAFVLGSSALLANFVPGVADVLSILGGLFGNMLMLVFPAMITLTIFKDEMTLTRAFGVGLMCVGSAFSFASVIFTVLNSIGVI